MKAKNDLSKDLEQILTEIQIEKIIPTDIKMKADADIKLALFKSYISIIPKLDYQKFFKRFQVI